MIRGTLAIVFLMFLFLSDFANAQDITPTKNQVSPVERETFLSVGAIMSPMPKEPLVVAASSPLQTEGANCVKRAKIARTVCVDNKDIAAALPIISGLTGVATGLADSCSKIGKALKVANTALTAYNVACSAAKMYCDTACKVAKGTEGPVQTQLKALAGNVENPTTAAAAGQAIPLAQGDYATIAGLAAECAGHAQRLMAAGAGLTSVIMQAGKANNCEKATATVDCNLTPNDATCVANVDCTLDSNQSKPVCICAKSPTAAGCAGAIGDNGGSEYQQANSNLSTSDVRSSGSFDASTTSADSLASGPGAGSGAGALPGGGSNGGGGGGVGGGAAQGKTGKTADGKALNTNILGGYEGGGGGGGSGSRSSASAGSAYNQYLPGGKKDPARGVASQIFANGEVTGGGGRSNWEKVTDRYRDNRSKLMTAP